MSGGGAERIIWLKRVLERTGLGRSALYRKIAEGTFPRQIRIAARCAEWRENILQKLRTIRPS